MSLMTALDIILFITLLTISLNTILVGWQSQPVLPTRVIVTNLLLTLVIASGLGYVGFNFACLGILLAGGSRVAMLVLAVSRHTAE